MCGIAGAVSLQNNPNIVKSIQRILDSQSSRGPDAQGLKSVEEPSFSVSFGHNRLSVLDLSADSNQPFHDSSGFFWLTYNGEIYNYLELRQELKQLGVQFRTTGDSEVLIESYKMWGESAFSRFIGMFSFAILDMRAKKVIVCRDRFGVKPLFYVFKNREFYFASTAHILAEEFNLKPNLEYVARGAAYQVYEDDSSKTMYEDLNCVEPGTYLRLQLNSNNAGAEKVRYYDFLNQVQTKIVSIKNFNDMQLIEQVRETFSAAVAIRMRTDAPFALSLSGGLDSASVAATAQNFAKSKLMGFHFGHPDANESEGPLVAELSKHCGIDVEYVWPKVDEIIESFDQVLLQQEAPFGGLSILAQNFVFAAARRRGFKVLLGGQGGDEGFMGYRKYLLFSLKSASKQPLQFLKQSLSLAPTILGELPSLSRYWKFRSKYMNQSGLQSAVDWGVKAKLALGVKSSDPLWRRQWADVTLTSLPTLLRFEDRNSMGHSIESRLPFMDHRLLELGLALPENLKIRDGHGKWVIREIMKGQIPKSISHARFKKGFNVNESKWIRGGLGHHLRNRLEKVRPQIEHLVSTNTFSDDVLCDRASALSEIISLIWFGEVLRRQS